MRIERKRHPKSCRWCGAQLRTDVEVAGSLEADLAHLKIAEELPTASYSYAAGYLTVAVKGVRAHLMGYCNLSCEERGESRRAARITLKGYVQAPPKGR